MENKICVLTTAGDSQIHLTRTSIYSFLETNQWFTGTIFLATVAQDPISDRNLALLQSLYQKIEVIDISSTYVYKKIEIYEKTQINYSVVQECLKAMAFGLSNKILFFSNTCLFLKDISDLISYKNSVVVLDRDLSIFYNGLYDESIVTESILENIECTNILSNSTITASISSALFNAANRIENLVDTYKSTYFKDSKFNILKQHLAKAKCIVFDNLKYNEKDYGKINSLWMQKNRIVSNFLNKPSSHMMSNLIEIKKPTLEKAKTPFVKKASTSKINYPHFQLPVNSKMLINREEALSFFDNKKICLVANSSELLKHKYGKFIDSHDIVVRFNGYKTLEEHTGKKVDVHCVFRDYKVAHTSLATIKVVISKNREKWAESIAKFHKRDAVNGKYKILDFNYPSSQNLIQSKCAGIPIPTSGLCMFVYFNQLGLGHKISLVGFNAYMGGNPSQILRINDDVNLASAHDYVKEKEYWENNFIEILPSVMIKA